MHSWRDGLSDASGAEVDRMLASAVRLAKQYLAGSSEFEPFALITDLEGRQLAVDLDKSSLGKHPDSEVIARATAAQLVHIADSAHCTVLIVNTRLSAEKTDAVEIRLEHRDGAALLVFLPYKRPRFGGNIEYSELMAFPGKHHVWAI